MSSFHYMQYLQINIDGVKDHRSNLVFCKLAVLRCVNMLVGEFQELRSTHLKVAKCEKHWIKGSLSTHSPRLRTIHLKMVQSYDRKSDL